MNFGITVLVYIGIGYVHKLITNLLLMIKNWTDVKKFTFRIVQMPLLFYAMHISYI